jgi:hypothetical protein
MAVHAGYLGALAWDPAGGTSYTNIAKIRDLTGPSISRNSIEVVDRSQTTFYNQYIGGRVDPGSISFDITWDPILDTTHAQATGTGLLSDFETTQCDQAAWRWQLDGCGGTATFTFDGFLESFEASAPMEDVLTASLSVKISGKPTLAIT